jgi:ribosome-binding protein aMBF1 (putative translation factor)
MSTRTHPTSTTDSPAHRIARALADPATARQVAAIRAEMAEERRRYQLGLTTVRKAAHLTQQQLAANMGAQQSAISRIERSDDLLLSTFAQYLAASGATRVTIAVDLPDTAVELELPLGHPSPSQ